MSNNWIKNLKVGEQFFTKTNFNGYTFYTVAKITKTQIVTKPKYCHQTKGEQFNIETGIKIGAGNWVSVWMEQITPEVLKEVGRKKRIYYLNEFDFSKLSDDDLWEIYKKIISKEGENNVSS
jgi:hypothetical protein